MQFLAKNWKIIALLGVGAPPWGKSWIRHCYCLNFMFNIADNYSGQLWMNKRQGLSIHSPYIMSQPVTDPEIELGIGQQTLNLYGRLRRPSFYDPIFQNQRGIAPGRPNNLFSQQTSTNHCCPPSPLYGFLHPHFAAFSKSTPPVAKSGREYRPFRGLVPTSLFSLRIFFAWFVLLVAGQCCVHMSPSHKREHNWSSEVISIRRFRRYELRWADSRG